MREAYAKENGRVPRGVIEKHTTNAGTKRAGRGARCDGHARVAVEVRSRSLRRIIRVRMLRSNTICIASVNMRS